MIDFMGAIGLYDRFDGPSPETRGIFGAGPWHPKAINHVRGARLVSVKGVASSTAVFDLSLWAILENAEYQLDDVQFRAQTDCARLTAYVDDITRVTEYNMRRARFAALVAMSSRLEGIHVSSI